MSIKEQLYNACKNYVDKREATITKTITSNQKSLQSETKSSAGDKHETGRAMLQLEMEKAGQHLVEINIMKEILAKINLDSNSNLAHLGSLIYTNKATYFLSISVGQIIIENEMFFAISASSPIGKLLLGKQKGDTITFNGNPITIKSIC